MQRIKTEGKGRECALREMVILKQRKRRGRRSACVCVAGGQLLPLWYGGSPPREHSLNCVCVCVSIYVCVCMRSTIIDKVSHSGVSSQCRWKANTHMLPVTTKYLTCTHTHISTHRIEMIAKVRDTHAIIACIVQCERHYCVTKIWHYDCLFYPFVRFISVEKIIKRICTLWENVERSQLLLDYICVIKYQNKAKSLDLRLCNAIGNSLNMSFWPNNNPKM